MFLATINKSKQLLHSSYIGHVKPAELERGLDDLKTLLTELSPGFRVLVDFGRLDSMDVDCVAPLGRGMELLDHAGVGLLVRLVPDPGKDIGLNILTAFHYSRRPRIANCKNILEASRVLEL